MAIPDRFNSTVPTTKGIVEVKILKNSDSQVDVGKLISTFDVYIKYIPNEDTIKEITYIENNVLKDFGGTFSLDFDQYPEKIKNYINLFIDTSTGYVTYKTDTDTKEIRLSDGVYVSNKILQDVSGKTLLDISNLETELNAINLKYDSDNDSINDGNNNPIIEKASKVNTDISNIESEITNINLKYDSDNDVINDGNNNPIIEKASKVNTDISNMESEITNINLKYDSDNDVINDGSNNTLLSDVKNINNDIVTLKDDYTSIGMKYDTEKIVSSDGNTVYLDLAITNERLNNTQNEVIFNLELDSTNGLNTETILDYNSAFTFATDSNNAKQIDASIDTSKLSITEININLTPYNKDDTDAIYIVSFKNITKDSNGNITGFSIVAYDLQGNQLDTYNASVLVKFKG